MCLVCGLDNSAGLQAAFYELENGELLALYRPRKQHQGYPGRLHGGLAAALLDETIGRTIMVGEQSDVWGVSTEVTTRFRKPIPLDGELRVVGRITKSSSRLFEGTGRILLADGSVAAEGKGKYLRLPLEKISDHSLQEQWKIVPLPDDPTDFEI
jgi:acyl-coenzyme A thioesterase PaaI-like protein